MEAYRYQQFAYLIVPVMLGVEFFLCARDEKKGKVEAPLGFYVLDFLGFLFMAVVPAIFIFTIWAVETKSFSRQVLLLARLDRYGVLFFFMGAWWQVYLFGALRARRMDMKEKTLSYFWLPFLSLGVFISLLILAFPWLKWVSVIWFFALFGVLSMCGTRLKIIERTMWVLSAFTFVAENLLFVWLDSVV